MVPSLFLKIWAVILQIVKTKYGKIRCLDTIYIKSIIITRLQNNTHPVHYHGRFQGAGRLEEKFQLKKKEVIAWRKKCVFLGENRILFCPKNWSSFCPTLESFLNLPKCFEKIIPTIQEQVKLLTWRFLFFFGVCFKTNAHARKAFKAYASI